MSPTLPQLLRSQDVVMSCCAEYAMMTCMKSCFNQLGAINVCYINGYQVQH